jgi:hypothetical protein
MPGGYVVRDANGQGECDPTYARRVAPATPFQPALVAIEDVGPKPGLGLRDQIASLQWTTPRPLQPNSTFLNASFCLASGTEWAQAGVTGATTTMMLVRGLVGGDSTGGLKMTP